MRLLERTKRKKTKPRRNCREIDQMDQTISQAKTSVTQQPTIAVNRRGGLPIQYIIQTQSFKKLEQKIPEFMEEAANNPTFPTDLKFNKPEINVTIDREKAESLNLVIDIAQTLTFTERQRFGLFHEKKESNTKS
jgi:HAE1 family hydrophobic/amphiphilic exporter-1/multidrug efflux pump